MGEKGVMGRKGNPFLILWYNLIVNLIFNLTQFFLSHRQGGL